jgi:phage baseplate assembly protein W
MSSSFDYPMHFDYRGRTAVTGEDDHIRDMIHQVLFTSPGERVNRPDFGCGLKQIVFQPNSDALAAATQVLVRSSLQRWLETVIQVLDVQVDAVEEQFQVQVTWRKRDDTAIRQDLFTAGGPVSA